MSRLRWSLGAALGLVALGVALPGLVACLTRHLWLAALTLLLLSAITVAGFVSLARARRRLEDELAGLAAEPPAGELYAARRALLEGLKARGVRPAREALADAAAAEERGRAYLGRYLVAVAVLVGLVGTFAGLAETLRAVGPILGQDGLSLAGLLARPLDGIGVTFSASAAGILVTLSLSLVQGDLALAEERALARLEERTTHVLVPALWPAEEDEARVAARELAGLRADVAALSRGLSSLLERAGEAAAARVGEAAGREVERLLGGVREEMGGAARALEAAGTRTAEQLASSSATVERAIRTAAEAVEASGERSARAVEAAGASAAAGLETTAAAVTAAGREATGALAEATRHAAAATRALEESGGATIRALERVGGEAAQAVREAAARAAGALADEAAALRAAAAAALQALDARAAAQLETLAAHLDAAATGLGEGLERAAAGTLDALVGRVGGALESVVQGAGAAAADLASRTEAALAAATTAYSEGAQSAAASLAAAAAAEQARLEEATRALAAAAAELRGAAEAIAPGLQPLERLGHELSALGRELALLAAARASDDVAPLLADEVARVGEGVERIEALLALGRAGAEPAEAT